MIKSIKYFQEEGIINLEKVIENFYDNPKDFPTLVRGILKEMLELGKRILVETLEEVDSQVRNSSKRKNQGWVVDQKDVKKELITSLGAIYFNKTYFYNKKTKEYRFLVDDVIGLEKNEKLTPDAIANIYTEAVQTSYRKGGENVSIDTPVSKETVKNCLHEIVFPKYVAPEKKKVVERLYIEADEDHVALQFNEKKGDLVINEQGRKNNGMINKLVVVHEGIAPEAPGSKRHRLVNPHYFCTSSMTDNGKFWKEVSDYIESTYEVLKIKKIYLNSDGGSWIKTCKDYIYGTVHVIDEFHLSKSLLRMTAHLKDSQDDAKRELRRIIRCENKSEFVAYVDLIKTYTEDEKVLGKIDTEKKYIHENWMACKLRVRRTEGVVGSSTEGQVSHVLSRRMSTLAMGWSRHGATQMGKLRAYYKNGGNMLELAEHQKQRLPKAAGSESEIFTVPIKSKATTSETSTELRKYFDVMQAYVPETAKKYAWLKAHEWLW